MTLMKNILKFRLRYVTENLGESFKYLLNSALPVLDSDSMRLLGIGCVSLSIEKKDYPYSLVAITSLDGFV
jgi:hypothetical protein